MNNQDIEQYREQPPINKQIIVRIFDIWNTGNETEIVEANFDGVNFFAKTTGRIINKRMVTGWANYSPSLCFIPFKYST